MSQDAEGVFAMILGYPDELGQDLPSLPKLCGRLIALSDRIIQFSHAGSRRHLLQHAAAQSAGRVAVYMNQRSATR